MKWFFFIILILTVACSGKTVISEEELGAELLYQEGTYKLYSGKGIVYYRNTSIIKEEFTYRKGVLHGETTMWYKNGQLKRKGCYKNGQISGRWVFYDESGKKTIEAYYKKDNLNGDFLMFYNNGKPKAKGKFAEDHKKGKWTCYDEKGSVISNSRY